MELSTSSISNEIEKSVQEEFSVSQAAIDEIRRRREKGQKPESISNEQIKKNDPILDTYKVLDDAIHGGMGSVWRVHHESWNVDLAMKRPQPRFFAEAGDGRKEEFIRECENWINLGLHPNIVSCYYVREIGGVPTIFSEWMDNGSLKDRIRDGSLYEGTEEEVQERILDIAIQTARGLKYSHENNLIHQDVKPGNILLTKDWDAKVADFGLAKAQSQLTENEKPVSTGYTIQYCPREQAEGAPAEKWMDVYAWALTVLEMYCGKRLWETGAEAEERCSEFLPSCRVPIPAAIRELLTDCLTVHVKNFGTITDIFEDEYKNRLNRIYPRPKADAMFNTADALSNQAVSYLEIGLTERGIQCLEKANSVDPHHTETMFNRALLDWRKGVRTDSQIYRQLLQHPYYSRTEAGHEALLALAREAGKNSFDETLTDGIPTVPVKDFRSVRLLHERIYGISFSRESATLKMSLSVLDTANGEELQRDEYVLQGEWEDCNIKKAELNADCTQVMLYLSDESLLLYDFTSHSVAAQFRFPKLERGDTSFDQHMIGLAGRFFRRRLCHLPHGRKMPFGSGVDTLHPVIDPPSEETYDLHTGMRLEHKYSDWELMRAGVDGELRPYPQQQYRFSLSDGWRSIGIMEDENGHRLYCDENGDPFAPVPPALDALLYKLWRDAGDDRVLSITEQAHIWITNGWELTEFDMVTGKALRSFSVSKNDNIFSEVKNDDIISFDEDGLGVLRLQMGPKKEHQWYYRSFEPIRPENCAPWLFSVPENYQQYQERTQRLEDVRAAFDQAEVQRNAAGMCAAYAEAEGIRGFYGTVSQQDMEARLRSLCRQKDSELFLTEQSMARKGDEKSEKLLAPFGVWRDDYRHWYKAWVYKLLAVSPDGQRALIQSGRNGGPSYDGTGLYLVDIPADKLYLLKKLGHVVYDSAVFCNDRKHILYGRTDTWGCELHYADISIGSQQAQEEGDWEKAEDTNSRLHKKDQFSMALFSTKPLPGTNDGVSVLWPYGIFTFRTGEDFDAFYSQPGYLMRILAADQNYGLIAYYTKDKQGFGELRVWSVDERHVLLHIPHWTWTRGDVRFARDDDGALRMLVAGLGLKDQDSNEYPVEIYQLRCAYAPEQTHRLISGPLPEWPQITLPECDWDDNRFGVGYAGESSLQKQGKFAAAKESSLEEQNRAYFIYCDLIRRFPESTFMESYRQKLTQVIAKLEQFIRVMRKSDDTEGLEKCLSLYQERLKAYPHESNTPFLQDTAQEALAFVLSGRSDEESLRNAKAHYMLLAERHPNEASYQKKAAAIQKQIDRLTNGEPKRRTGFFSFFK